MCNLRSIAYVNPFPAAQTESKIAQIERKIAETESKIAPLPAEQTAGETLSRGL